MATSPNAARHDTRLLRRPMVAALALSVMAALAYVLIAWGVLAVGDPQVAQDGGAMIYVAAASYLLGGLLILAGRRAEGIL